MRTIIVDDEPIMIKGFQRISKGIDEIELIGQFRNPEDAIAFARREPVELAILDISMPGMTGIELAQKLRENKPDILVVFITAYDKYISDSNRIGADDYIIKPYKRKIIERMAQKMNILSQRQQKPVFVRTFGRFSVLKNGEPVKLTGKAKEILALVTTRRGKEISNEEIYCTLWEDREYSNTHMKVYYNALKRLKDTLKDERLEKMLISTTRGQMINTEMFDCDYYNWQDNNMRDRDKFEGEFMSEYSWGEYLLAEIVNITENRTKT